jgi:hypothetical protein
VLSTIPPLDTGKRLQKRGIGKKVFRNGRDLGFRDYISDKILIAEYTYSSPLIEVRD